MPHREHFQTLILIWCISVESTIKEELNKGKKFTRLFKIALIKTWIKTNNLVLNKHTKNIINTRLDLDLTFQISLEIWNVRSTFTILSFGRILYLILLCTVLKLLSKSINANRPQYIPNRIISQKQMKVDFLKLLKARCPARCTH